MHHISATETRVLMAPGVGGGGVEFAICYGNYANPSGELREQEV